jgi:hypothetical protein
MLLVKSDKKELWEWREWRETFIRGEEIWMMKAGIYRMREGEVRCILSDILYWFLKVLWKHQGAIHDRILQ